MKNKERIIATIILAIILSVTVLISFGTKPAIVSKNGKVIFMDTYVVTEKYYILLHSTSDVNGTPAIFAGASYITSTERRYYFYAHSYTKVFLNFYDPVSKKTTGPIIGTMIAGNTTSVFTASCTVDASDRPTFIISGETFSRSVNYYVPMDIFFGDDNYTLTLFILYIIVLVILSAYYVIKKE